MSDIYFVKSTERAEYSTSMYGNYGKDRPRTFLAEFSNFSCINSVKLDVLYYWCLSHLAFVKLQRIP